MPADDFVRPARPDDLTAIGRVQSRAWSAAYAGLLDGAGGVPSAEDLAAAWADAVTSPPPRHQVLVATAGGEVVGLAAVAPAAPDAPGGVDEGVGELVVLVVDPDHGGAGHGSRLLNAAVDTLRATGATTLRTWVPEADAGRVAFLAEAGLEPDGVVRTLSGDGSGEDGSGDDGSGEDAGGVREVRLSAEIAP